MITNNPKRTVLSDLTHMISMVDHLVISVKILHIDRGYSFEKDFVELICMNL